MWLRYFLIRLFMRDEVVVFFTGGGLRLFFHGAVYELRNLLHLPKDLDERVTTVWCLIDWDMIQTSPPADLVARRAKRFIVQASPPNPIRYATWLKQFSGFTWGLADWTIDNLVSG